MTNFKTALSHFESTTVAIRKLPGGTGALSIRYLPKHNVARRTASASNKLKSMRGIKECIELFRCACLRGL